jgi:hypothetical protein
VLFSVIIGAISFGVEAASCHSKYSAYNPSWGIISGCQVEWNGKITPVENIRLI